MITKDNLFDFYEAMHCYLTVNHEGLRSRQYELLCQSEFTPSPSWSETKVIKENEYFNLINDANYEILFEQLNRELKNELDNQ
jgi:hypothetical protein